MDVLYIAHRINTIDELKSVPTNYGVEIDIRDRNDDIILSHDPFNLKDCVTLRDYMKFYNHSFIILNVKSEGIEHRARTLMKVYGVTNYFFLDSSFPMIKRLLNIGEKNIAIRYSEYESIETIHRLRYRPKYIWVDCFNKFSLSKWDYKKLIASGVKICYVSPELQDQPEKIDAYKRHVMENKLIPDMICTKLYNIKRWM